MGGHIAVRVDAPAHERGEIDPVAADAAHHVADQVGVATTRSLSPAPRGPGPTRPSVLPGLARAGGGGYQEQDGESRQCGSEVLLSIPIIYYGLTAFRAHNNQFVYYLPSLTRRRANGGTWRLTGRRDTGRPAQAGAHRPCASGFGGY